MGRDFLDYLADRDFNPWWGCVKVSPGCDNCFAEGVAHMRGHKVWGKDAPRRFMGVDHWMEPISWNRKAQAEGRRWRVFCGNMCDVMEENKSADLQEWREVLYDLILRTPWLIWMLTTKRPDQYKRRFPREWTTSPPPNLWLLTTVESADYLWRVDALMQVPAAIRATICEPLLSDITLPQSFLKLQRDAWVMVGTERRGRPAQVEWVRHIRDQAVDAGIPFFFNQWGDHMPGPDGLHMIKCGSNEIGNRMVDGQEWNQVPPAAYIVP